MHYYFLNTTQQTYHSISKPHTKYTQQFGASLHFDRQTPQCTPSVLFFFLCILAKVLYEFYKIFHWIFFRLCFNLSSDVSISNSTMLNLLAVCISSHNSRFCGSQNFNLKNISVVFRKSFLAQIASNTYAFYHSVIR